MNYKEYSKDKTALMIFLHGGGVSGWMWDRQVSYFSSQYHVVVPDLPGHGKSRGESFSIQDSAEQVIKLIKEKRRERPVFVIGFSLGAQILVQMLSLTKDLIDVAIINSALTIPIKYEGKYLLPILKITYPLVKVRAFAKLQSKVLYITEDQFELYYEESSQTKLNTFMQVMDENMSFQIPDSYSESNANILITVGDLEKPMMKESAEKLVQLHHQAEGIIIPKIGHGVSLANPDYFNQLVEGWISKGLLPNDVKRIQK